MIDDKEYELEAVWEHGGTIMTFYFITSRTYMAEEDIAWDIYYEYKKGKLYLTIKEDNIGNYEGQTIVLEPQECGT